MPRLENDVHNIRALPGRFCDWNERKGLILKAERKINMSEKRGISCPTWLSFYWLTPNGHYTNRAPYSIFVSHDARMPMRIRATLELETFTKD